jgi:hypothetical protein
MLASDLASTAAFAKPDELDRFSAHLNREWIDEALASTGSATMRRRRLPADLMVWLVIGMALMRNRPILEVVRALAIALPTRAGKTAVAASSVAQARARLGADPLEWLFLRTTEPWGHASANRHRWRGLAVYGVDGTTVRVADSPENRAAFGGQSTHRGDSGYPLVRLVVLMALRSRVLVSASFGPYADEYRYAEDLWQGLPDHSLTIVDRAFLGANLLIPIERGGTERHFLTRAKSTTRWRVVERLGRGDFIAEIDVTHYSRQRDPSLPRTWRVRVIEYQRKGFRKQSLITSLLDAARYPADEIIELYHERWELELGYDEIKTNLLEREETIRSRTVAGVRQELWGLLIAYNLVRLEMERIADEAGVKPNRISFVAAVRTIRTEWEWSAITRSPGAIPRHLAEMRETIAAYILPPRRNRSYPRAVKLKMSNYPRKRPSPRKGRPK